MIVAIDGPAASGKGTLAVRLARHLWLPHLDTGLLYRETARILIDNGEELGNAGAAAEAARRVHLTEASASLLRGRAMSEAASVIAAYPEVRNALIELQRSFAMRPGGAVLDGRDIGTVVCPWADRKIFLTAAPEARAARRALEMQSRGEIADYRDILEDIRKRDERDSGRSSAPLRAAVDAFVIDTTDLDVEASFQQALKVILAQDEKETRGTKNFTEPKFG